MVASLLLVFVGLHYCGGSSLNYDRSRCCETDKLSRLCSDDCMLEQLSDDLWNQRDQQSLCNRTELDAIDVCLAAVGERYAVMEAKSVAQKKLRQEIGIMRLDHAIKLHCCSRATPVDTAACPDCQQCSTMCRERYGSFAGDHHLARHFETECLNSPAQIQLQQCIREVDHPCQLGCPLSDMNFCRSVVDPLTTLYSRCSKQSDDDAKNVFDEWMNHSSIRIGDLHIPVRHLTECLGERFWRKAICDHSLGRCTEESHSALMCKNDCIKLVASCIANTRGFPSMTDIESMCDAIPFVADEKHPCISPFGDLPSTQLSDSSPCDLVLTIQAFSCAFQCNANEICRTYRENGIVGHVCEKACTVPWTGSHRHLPSAASIAVGETIVTQLNVPSLLFVQPPLQKCTCRWAEAKDVALITDCQPLTNTAASTDYIAKCPKYNQSQLRLKTTTGESVLFAAWFGSKPTEDWDLTDALTRVLKRFTNVAVCDIVVHVDDINVIVRFSPIASFKQYLHGQPQFWTPKEARSVTAICDAELQRWYVALSQKSARLLADPLLSQLRCFSFHFVVDQNQQSSGKNSTLNLSYFLLFSFLIAWLHFEVI